MVRFLRRSINVAIWLIISVYVVVTLLVNIPAVKRYVGSRAAGALQELLATEVSIGSVDLGLLNRVILSDVVVCDTMGQEMLRVGRLSVKVSVGSALRGKITISSAQLFGMNATLYKPANSETPNYQFVLDALASDDGGEKTTVRIAVNSLIIRHSRVAYDDWSYATTTHLDPHHIELTDISAHVIARTITNDSVNIHVKRLSCKEHSGITLRRAMAKVTAGTTHATVTDCLVALPASQLHLTAEASYHLTTDTTTHVSHLHYTAEVADSYVAPYDLHLIDIPADYASSTIAIAAAVEGTDSTIVVSRCDLSQDDNLSLSLSATAARRDSITAWQATLHELTTTGTGIDNISRLFDKASSLPAFVPELGAITLTGDVADDGHDGVAQMLLTTDVGTVAADLQRHNSVYSGTVTADSVDLAMLTHRDDLATTSLTVTGTADITRHELTAAMVSTMLHDLSFRQHTYHDVAVNIDYHRLAALNITATIPDPLGTITADITTANVDLHAFLRQDLSYDNITIPETTLSLTAENVCPHDLNLTEGYPSTTFSGHLQASLRCNGIEHTNADVTVSDLIATDSVGTHTLAPIALHADTDDNNHKVVSLHSDFAQLRLEGDYAYATLYDSFCHAITSQLPVVPLGSPTVTPHNSVALYATLLPANTIYDLLNIPLHLTDEAHIIARVNDDSNTLTVNADAKDLTYNGTQYSDNYLVISTPRDTIRTTLHTLTTSDDNTTELTLRTKAYNNQLSADIDVDSHHDNVICGSLHAVTDFNHQTATGQQIAEVDILPSTILVADTTWIINPAHITYHEKYLNIEHLNIHHNDQYLDIHGTAEGNSASDIIVDTNDVNVAYILDFVNFHTVAFDGYATGQVTIHSLFDTPAIQGTFYVSHFAFEHQPMGNTDITIGYDFGQGAIQIDAIVQEEEWRNTTVNGYVNLKEKYIDLAIVPTGATVNFLSNYCRSFATLSNSTGSGTLNVVGPLKQVQLLGAVTITSDIYIPSIFTSYHIDNQSVTFATDDIIFANDTIVDCNGNRGILAGHLTHTHLSNFSYDFTVTANNLLALNKTAFDEDPFLGTVIANGSCRIHEVPNGTRIDIDVAPQEGSFITYNATAPDRLSDTFITWHDRADHSSIAVADTVASLKTVLSDVNINFVIRCSDASQLRILMDDRTGDLITLNGNGIITAHYYNKGAFNLFGNYTITTGTYRMTIQDVIQRDFTFQPNGTLSFAGDTSDARINLQAIYSLASVPLADINIGKSFSNNNVRVDCIMNITGSPLEPTIDFDLDLPTLGAETKSMIMNMFADNEELNQQVIYLIAVGRFLNQYANNSSQNALYSQTSLAMQSFLSGTVSQQINNVLESVIGTNKWNFGANISPGEEGFNDAEYEGLISGSMLNNRLIFNGQFGYRDNPNATSSFIGDFDLRYLLVPTGSIAVRIYNETNNRYFTKNTLNTQGVGLIIKKDFSSWRDLTHKHAGK